MAMTLDELLGRDVQDAQTLERFPAYEEFASSRARAKSLERTYDYDLAVREDVTLPYMQVRSRSNVNAKPYMEGVDFNDTEIEEIKMDMECHPVRTLSFYEYASRDRSRLSDDVLDGKLSHTIESFKPVFEEVSDEEAQVATRTRGKVRAHLNTKGKIALGAFLALVVTVMSLVIGFSSKINNGTATMPASNATAIVRSVEL